MHSQPFRSVLYVPAANARAVEKAWGLPVDAIILDLEDAVAPAEKGAARDALALALRRPRDRPVIARINGLDTSWGVADAATARIADAVLVPKVGSPDDLYAVAALVGDRPLWAMIETAAGVLAAPAIAAHPRLAGLVVGTNDLARELGVRDTPDRRGLQTSLGLAVLAGRAHGRVTLDGVYNAFRDEAGFRAEAEAGRDLGFDGKTLIHPGQIATANAVFGPTEAEVDLARRQIAAHEGALAAGQGIAVLDGRIVEALHVATARATLSRAEAIAKAEATR